MSDLIDREAVLDSLKEHRALYCDNTPDTFSKLSYAEKSRVDELDTAIATIINLPSAENKGEWIPVPERLPEEDKEVLIFTKDKEINKAYHTLKEWSDTEWEWFVFGTLGYSLTYSDDEVLAWQPLPEPYKTESEDKE